MNEDYLSDYTPQEILALREILLHDFEAYAKFAFKCQTGAKLEIEPHHRILCDYINKVIAGEITRGVITIPPRHSKTAFFTVLLISRSYAGCAESECIQTSFSDNNVKTNAEDILKILQHPSFRKVFGVQVKSVNQDKITTTAGGKCHNRTSKGAITGVGAGVTTATGFSGLLSIDDPIKPSDANSPTVRNFTNETLYTQTLSNRCNSPSVPQIIIMQRLNDLDLVNYVLTGNSGENWSYLNIPAIITETTGSKEYYDRICKKYSHAVPYYYHLDMNVMINRNIEQEFLGSIELQALYSDLESYKATVLPERLKAGRAALWAKKRTLQYYDAISESNNKYFMTQYMGEPSIDGGSVFKEEWFQYYDGFSSLDVRDIVSMRIYVDTAMKTGEQNDFSVFTSWVKTRQGNIYLVDGLHQKWEAPELQKEFEAFYKKMKEIKRDKYRWRLECAKIEDKASGTGLIQQCSRLAGFNIIPIQRNKDKYSRACEVTPELAAGRVFLPTGMTITQLLIDEACAFTDNDTHAHDDIVDTMMDAIQDLIIDPNNQGSKRGSFIGKLNL